MLATNYDHELITFEKHDLLGPANLHVASNRNSKQGEATQWPSHNTYPSLAKPMFSGKHYEHYEHNMLYRQLEDQVAPPT